MTATRRDAPRRARDGARRFAGACAPSGALVRPATTQPAGRRRRRGVRTHARAPRVVSCRTRGPPARTVRRLRTFAPYLLAETREVRTPPDPAPIVTRSYSNSCPPVAMVLSTALRRRVGLRPSAAGAGFSMRGARAGARRRPAWRASPASIWPRVGARSGKVGPPHCGTAARACITRGAGAAATAERNRGPFLGARVSATPAASRSKRHRDGGTSSASLEPRELAELRANARSPPRCRTRSRCRARGVGRGGRPERSAEPIEVRPGLFASVTGLLSQCLASCVRSQRILRRSRTGAGEREGTCVCVCVRERKRGRKKAEDEGAGSTPLIRVSAVSRNKNKKKATNRH